MRRLCLREHIGEGPRAIRHLCAAGRAARLPGAGVRFLSGVISHHTAQSPLIVPLSFQPWKPGVGVHRTLVVDAGFLSAVSYGDRVLRTHADTGRGRAHSHGRLPVHQEDTRRAGAQAVPVSLTSAICLDVDCLAASTTAPTGNMPWIRARVHDIPFAVLLPSA